MKTIIILTGNELRHEYFRKKLGTKNTFKILKTYCESADNSLSNQLKEEPNSYKAKHIENRTKSEEEFFATYVANTPDNSNPNHIPKYSINDNELVNEIITLNPDLIISYGCSLIKEPLVNAFKNRFINVHLGLSPYYRGSGTNFWPLVNNEPEYVGATFMYIDLGIDTGEIIHQIRATLKSGDTPSSIGNQLIKDMTETFISLIENFDSLTPEDQLPKTETDKLYLRKHFTEDSVKTLYKNFENNLVDTYLNNQETRIKNAPIITNKGLS